MKTIFNALTAGLFAVMTTASFAQPGAPNDVQIAGIVVAANTVDIEAGKLAASNQRIRKSRSSPNGW